MVPFLNATLYIKLCHGCVGREGLPMDNSPGEECEPVIVCICLQAHLKDYMLVTVMAQAKLRKGHAMMHQAENYGDFCFDA